MRRLSLIGLAATLAVVALLLVSLVRGVSLGGGEGEGAGRPAAEPGRRIRVEVLNAAGVPGLARGVTERLRARGFDVVYYGNAPAAFGRDSSLVIDRTGDPGPAREVADALGIERVRTLADTTLYLEATVVVGRDWAAGADSASTAEAAGPER